MTGSHPHAGSSEKSRKGGRPAAPFGHGLGWTDWRYDRAWAPVITEGGDVRVRVQVTNVGARPGTEVVQCYLAPADPTTGPERPVRWLAGSAVVSAGPGDTVTTTVTLRRRTFEVWDPAGHGWVVPEQDLLLHLGRSSGDLRLIVPLPGAGFVAELVRHQAPE